MKIKLKSTPVWQTVIEIILLVGSVSLIALCVCLYISGARRHSAAERELQALELSLSAAHDQEAAAQKALAETQSLYDAALQRNSELSIAHAEAVAANTAASEQYEMAQSYPELYTELRSEYAAAIRRLEDKILAGESDYKIAYLTFDDGPYPSRTGEYLDVLKEYDVNASFFVLGYKDRDELYRREMLEGHSICNHTYSHAIRGGIYTGVDAFMTDVEKLDEHVYSVTGMHTDIVRFPGGSTTAKSNKTAITEALSEKGYGWVDWTALTGDAEGGTITKQYCLDRLHSTLGSRKISVILMHDFSKPTLDALPTIIEELTAKGYLLLPLFYESVMVNK